MKSMNFATMLRTQRELRGHGLRELARMTRVTAPYLCRIEGGCKQPTEKLAVRLAKALKGKPEVFVAAALQDRLDAAGLRFTVEVR